MTDIRKYFNIVPNEKKEQTNTLENNSITIFTDGSSLNNGQKNKYQAGGIGVYFEDTKEMISEKLTGKITNNIAELKACIKGINHAINRDNYQNNTIILYSDSEYVINSMTKWAITWKKNDWKKYDKKKGKVEIKNKDLIIELYTLYNKHPITFIHTKSHGVKPSMQNTKEYKIWYGNYMADKLAVEASNS
jgi:ribonuclease HI